MKKLLVLFSSFGLTVSTFSPLTRVVSCSDPTIDFNALFFTGQTTQDAINKFYIKLNNYYNGYWTDSDTDLYTNYYSDDSTASDRVNLSNKFDQNEYYSIFCLPTTANQADEPTSVFGSGGTFDYWTFRDAQQKWHDAGSVNFPDTSSGTWDNSIVYTLYYFTNFNNYSSELKPDDGDDGDIDLDTVPESTDTDNKNYTKWTNWGEDVVAFTLNFVLLGSDDDDGGDDDDNDQLSNAINSPKVSDDDDDDDDDVPLTDTVGMRVDWGTL